MCRKYGFRKGVPYSLSEREDFNFVDVAQMVLGKFMKRLTSWKSKGSVYQDALLPYEAQQLFHEKEKELQLKHVLKMAAEHEAARKSHFECGESGAAP